MRFSKLAVFAVASAPAAALTPYTVVPFRRSSRARPLRAAGELVEGTKAALDALPLFLAPSAALAAGQQALSQKKTLEIEVASTEKELKDIKRKIKNTDLQINASVA